MSPANAGVILAAGIDCCVLANNQLLDSGSENDADIGRAHFVVDAL